MTYSNRVIGELVHLGWAWGSDGNSAVFMMSDGTMTARVGGTDVEYERGGHYRPELHSMARQIAENLQRWLG
jgi:hypothetical protein